MIPLSEEYELLVRDLHDALVKNDSVDNVSVRHNVKIRGKSGAMHQIDVYWEFDVAGVKYKTCIECKHHNRKVQKSAVASFVGVLDDIGNTNGIFATTVGYQSGAASLALHKGIRLLTVNFLLKSVHLTSNFIVPETEILEVQFDNDQAKAILKIRGLTSFEIKEIWNKHTPLRSSTGVAIDTLGKYMDREIETGGTGSIYPVEVFTETGLGLLRIQEIKYRRTTHHIKSEQEIVTNATTRAILEDVSTNLQQYLHDDGSISHIEA